MRSGTSSESQTSGSGDRPGSPGLGSVSTSGSRPAVPGPRYKGRFGLVLYGGVSLAIYIYGVVFEFWRLVRASRGAETNGWTEI